MLRILQHKTENAHEVVLKTNVTDDGKLYILSTNS